MLPWIVIDRAQLPGGGQLVLSRRGDEYAIRIDGQELMSTRSHRSEEQLAVHGCADLKSKNDARVLLGGLGMGFTLRATLDALGPSASVDVVELVPAVIGWNREIFADLTGNPLGDERLRVIEGDLIEVIKNTKDRYDAVLLDIDNGPSALTLASNQRLYSSTGLARIARILRPGGMLGLWSASEDEPFSALLRRAGFTVQLQRVRSGQGRGTRHLLWLARLVRHSNDGS